MWGMIKKWFRESWAEFEEAAEWTAKFVNGED
jgi:hypothetical protein